MKTIEEKVAYTNGYMESMQWRDPDVELPESQEIVLVKSDNVSQVWLVFDLNR